jgi:hypothetical protein
MRRANGYDHEDSFWIAGRTLYVPPPFVPNPARARMSL